MSTTHTILLVQPSKKPEGRTYSDYESVNDCMEGVCRIYEEHLKKSNPSSSQITYDISQVGLTKLNNYFKKLNKLFDFIDELQDLACFVYKGNSKSYQPFNREWIKEKIYSLLKKQATGK